MDYYKFENGKLIPTKEDGKTLLPLPTPGKGEFGGECNRTACNERGAVWYNTSTRKHYCLHCARLIGGGVHDTEAQIMFLDARVYTEDPLTYDEHTERVMDYAQKATTIGEDNIVKQRSIAMIGGVYSHILRKVIYSASPDTLFFPEYFATEMCYRYPEILQTIKKSSTSKGNYSWTNVMHIVYQLLDNVEVFINDKPFVQHPCTVFRAQVLRELFHRYHVFAV